MEQSFPGPLWNVNGSKTESIFVLKRALIQRKHPNFIELPLEKPFVNGVLRFYFCFFELKRAFM